MRSAAAPRGRELQHPELGTGHAAALPARGVRGAESGGAGPAGDSNPARGGRHMGAGPHGLPPASPRPQTLRNLLCASQQAWGWGQSTGQRSGAKAPGRGSVLTVQSPLGTGWLSRGVMLTGDRLWGQGDGGGWGQGRVECLLDPGLPGQAPLGSCSGGASGPA